MPTLTINIADRGTPLAGGGESSVGHMWYVVNDGNGNTYSYGFAPDPQHHGDPFAPGDRYRSDSDNYQETAYTETVQITQEQFDALKTFGEDPAAAGFDMYYNGLWNSCIDFVWKALERAGFDTDGFEGNPWPTHNIDDVEALIEKLRKDMEDAKRTVSPLILDLDGDGVETLNVDIGVHFDHDANGFAEQTGWVGKDDGLLVRDIDGNGSIDNGRELFGNNTQLANGAYAENGFAALADLDANHDGVISSADAGFTSLRIWKDLDSDNVTDAGELLTLSAAGVQSILTSYTSLTSIDTQGNEHRQQGGYTTTSGQTRGIDDVWFAQDRANTINITTVPVSAAIAALPDLQGFGNVPSLHQAMALDTSGHLQGLVEAFAAEPDATGRAGILRQIIFAWTGVENLSSSSRGAYVDDGRTVYALEAFLGETFIQGSGTNAGTPQPGPAAAEVLDRAFEELSAYMGARLMAQTHFRTLYGGLVLDWDPTSSAMQWDVSGAVDLLEAAYLAEPVSGAKLLRDFVTNLHTSGTYGRHIASLLQSEGDMQAGGFRTQLAGLGYDSVGMGDGSANTLNGSGGTDLIAGGDGNDTLNGDAGDDLLDGGSGDDHLSGGSGNDYLSGGLGDDQLSGGAGSDTYQFRRGGAHDTIENYDTSAGRFDVLQLQDIAQDEVQLTRVGNDLLIGISGTTDQISVHQFFVGGTAAGFALNGITFGNGTSWDLRRINQEMMSQGTEGSDTLSALPTGNTLYGYGGTDHLNGSAGSDQLYGGDGDDWVAGAAGNDTLQGDAGADHLYGGVGNDILDGGNGVDVLEGDVGDDVYRFGRGSVYDEIYDSAGFDIIELASGITPDDVTLVRTSTRPRLGPSIGDSLALILDDGGDQLLVGSFYAASGSRGIEQIRFADGTVWDAAAIAAHTVDHSGTVSSLVDTSSDDLLTVDHSSDTVTGVGGGIDSVSSNVTFELPYGIENLTLTGEQALAGTGNELDNIITGNVAANWLDGGQGADTFLGDLGNDTYYVDGLQYEVSHDTVIENVNEGHDTVVAQGAVWSVTLSANVEELIVGNLGYSWIAGERVFTGNALDNRIDASHGGSVVQWVTLRIDGGAGADLMIGGLGKQTYVVDSILDVVQDLQGQGDQIESSVSYTLPSSVATLILTGAAPTVGTGDAFNNRIDGSQNTAANTLVGGLGDDVYVVDASDVIVEALDEGVDTVEVATTYSLQSNLENVVLRGTAAISAFGNGGNNRLDGSQNSAGNVLSGGLGDDTYVISGVDSSYGEADVVIESAGEGVDTVVVADPNSSHTLGQNVENGVAGSYGVGVTGNAGDNVLTSAMNSWGSTLIGGAGNDTLIAASSSGLGVTLRGGSGADTYRILTTAGDSTRITDTDPGAVQDASIDTVEFASSVTPSALAFSRGESPYDLLVQWAGGGQLSISRFLAEGDGQDRVELFRFADGTTLTAAQILAAMTITGTAGDDVLSAPATGADLYGLAGNDTLNGGAGNDLLDGGTGADAMTGGAGNDLYRVDDAGDAITEASDQGIDTVEASISFVLGANVENLTLLGANSLSGTGNAADNLILGNSGANVLSGGEGNDTLDGVAGLDTLVGGAGNDVYRVSEQGDAVVEASDEGRDTVEGSTSYTLSDNVEVLVLREGGAFQATGNALDNEIWGNSSDNVIDGGLGGDRMVGGAGNDTYLVDDTTNPSLGDWTEDLISEEAASGTDTVISSVSWSLDDNLENLTLSGTANLTGTGNGFSNILIGNSGNNTLNGGNGDDTLDGSAGGDTMRGQQGNDVYVADSASDVVIESSGQGTDTVQSYVNWTLGSNVENLVLLGTFNLNGTGNGLANAITGNAGNNTLNGGTGADTLTGAVGNDTYVVDNAGDVITENTNEGTDLIQSSATYTLSANVENLTLTGTSAISGTGNELDNVLTGNGGNNTLTGAAGNDTLDGAAGNDTMLGGAGDDVYVVAQAADVVTENANEGTDLVRSSVTYTLGNNVENLTLTGTTAINGTGNTLDNVLTGNSATNTLTGNAGNDTLDGGSGTDTMVGGTGNDTYYVDVSADMTTENANEGIDTVNSSVTRTLAASIELLFLTGTNAINGTGNALSNLLRGNSVNNTLAGGGAADILEGLAGNDTLSNTTGNTLLNGGAGADTLTGTANNDLFIGGTGNDAVTTGSGADIILFNRGDGQDTVAASTTRDNTISIGGGVVYADLLFTKSGNDLILQLGGADQIKLTGFYASASNHSVNLLQVIIEGTSDYNAGSSDPMKNKKVESFNFEGLVTAFDAARVADPNLTSWSLSNALLAQHLSGSDTAALGGDLAYRYGRVGSLSEISFTPALGILSAANFGTSAQTLQALASLQDSSARLSA